MPKDGENHVDSDYADVASTPRIQVLYVIRR